MQRVLEIIRMQLSEQRSLLEQIDRELSTDIAAAVGLLVAALAAGNKLLVMGNGGSAADAQHFAAELVGRFKLERRALPAIALTTDTSALTAIGNDYGFDRIFSRQVEALARPGDVVVGISTSGNSANIAQALQSGRDAGCHTIALLGRDGGAIKGMVDLPLVIPSDATPRIQEGHIIVIHILCDLLEQALFSGSTAA
jgi:D-sedoheptulose 7-phosphate isomerase